MLKTILIGLMSFFLATNGPDKSIVRVQQNSQSLETATLEKMIAANGSVTMDLDLSRMNGGKSQSQPATLHFTAAPDSFFTILVFNGDLRGSERGAMKTIPGIMPGIIPQNSALLPATLNASINQLMIETQVGLAVGTDSCNAGAVPLNWLALPNNDHPVIPQNLYRMSGGATNDDRFEQVGQSSVKHAFTALQQDICGFGCTATASTTLGAGALLDAEYNRTFVPSEYFGFLRRNPDINGFLFWLNQVNSGPLRDVARQHAMNCSFITSQEYQQRFASIFTRSNANCH